MYDSTIATIFQLVLFSGLQAEIIYYALSTCSGQLNGTQPCGNALSPVAACRPAPHKMPRSEVLAFASANLLDIPADLQARLSDLKGSSSDVQK